MSETLEKKPIVLRLLTWAARRRPYYLIRNADGSPYLLRILIRGYLPAIHGIYLRPEPTQAEIEAAKAAVTAEPLRILGMRIPFNIYLHRFYREDQDRDLHNHPWKWSWAWSLSGGYIEDKRNRRTGATRRRRIFPGMLNILGQRDFHKVIRILGRETWSLFCAGGKGAAWGFIPDGLFCEAGVYLRAKGYVDEGPAKSQIPEWLEECFLCGGMFPPPVRYSVRRLPHHGGEVAPVCENCGNLARGTRQEDVHAGV